MVERQPIRVEKRSIRHATVALAVLLVFAGCSASGQEPDEPEPASDTPADSESSSTAALAEIAPSMRLTCEVSCSETKLRTPVVKLTWSGPGTLQGNSLVPSAATGSGSAEVLQERLDASVFADGFASDAYASFQTLQDEGTPTPLVAAPAPIHPAYAMQIVEVNRDVAADEEFVGSSALAGGLDEMELNSVVLEGLQPGLNYSWRLVVETENGWEVSDTVVCQAPACPADMVDLEEEP